MSLSPLDAETLTALQNALPPVCFKPIEPRYLDEPRGFFHGVAGAVLAPDTVQDVAKIVNICNRNRVGIVPYGGGTGLVGGQVMPKGPAPVILSLERLNNIREVAVGDNVIVAEAGVILSNLQAAAAKVDRLFALSLASEGSCQIGGNLATNAGGIGVLRYGNARDLCLGLEAVLPDGTIWHGLKHLRKDNTGYDLKNLLIGAEGSLGIITAAALKLHPRPRRMVSAFLCVKDPAAALRLLGMFQADLAGSISAFELIHRQGLEFLREKLPAIRHPFKTPGEWMVLADISLNTSQEPNLALEHLLARAMELGLVEDALISQNEAQRRDFWTLRETIPEANRLIGAINSHDISVPISRIPDLIAQGKTALATFGDLRINCFGHLGDGNLHYNVYPPKGGNRDDFSHLRAGIKDVVYGLVDQLGGSISAEHGIGRLKLEDLQKYGDPAKIAAMRAIKFALDPNDIMNPGAVVCRP